MNRADLAVANPPLSAEEERLWRAKVEASAEVREQLFTLYQPFARQVAARHFRDRRSGDIEFQDLCQLAYAGLLEAIDHFDPQRSVPFRAYAGRRIGGSVLNGLAKMSELREQISYRNRVRGERIRSLAPATLTELPPVDALEVLGDLAAGLALGFMLEGAGLAQAEAGADPGPNAYESLAWRDLVARLTQAVADLPPREALVIRHHYLMGVTFEQLGRLMGISKGRVSQLHLAAIARLRTGMRPPPTFNLQR